MTLKSEKPLEVERLSMNKLKSQSDLLSRSKPLKLSESVLTSEIIFSLSPVIPVLVIKKLEDTLPLAEALVKGGAKVLEITLRTPIALEIIKQLRSEFPDTIIGAGTVIHPSQLEGSIESGAQFTISPGTTSGLLQAAQEKIVPLIPGISTISELMQGIELGYRCFKFFPAEIVGGIGLLKTIFNVFPSVSFCPTGGINATNFLNYLKLPNVKCVGGTWVVADNLIEEKNWQKITQLYADALKVSQENSI